MDLENEMFKRLSSAPNLLPTKDDEPLVVVSKNGKKFSVRLITFIQGPLMAEVEHTDGLMYNLGYVLAIHYTKLHCRATTIRKFDSSLCQLMLV